MMIPDDFWASSITYHSGNVGYSQKMMKMGDYADSGPLWQGARSFLDVESITIVFGTRKGVRKAVSKIDKMKNVLSWTLLPPIPPELSV